jgi:glycosyltransferase involved in cell wall biosynthesis
VVIPNPVLAPPTIATSTPIRLGLGVRKRLLAVGRLEYQKGFDVLVNVFARVAPAFTEWELVIVGEGSLRSELQDRITALHLTDRVVLAGYTPDVGAWYRSAQLFVCSSRFEGFPNALVEAMAYGLPSISFDCKTGPREIIRDGIDGILVPAADEGALLAALGRAMSDAGLRERLGRRAAEVRTRFGITTISNLWETLFDTLRS